jgi:hypothetical protein
VLRDWSGFVQLRWDTDTASQHNQAEAFTMASSLHTESVVHVVGVVRARPADMVNSQMPNGTVEVEVERYSIFNAASLTPIPAPNIKSAVAHLPVFLPAAAAAPTATPPPGTVSFVSDVVPATSYYYDPAVSSVVSTSTPTPTTKSASPSSVSATSTNTVTPVAIGCSGLASEELQGCLAKESAAQSTGNGGRVTGARWSIC